MKRRDLAAFGCLLLSLHPAFAYDLSDSLQINGFGTLGVSTNDSDEIQFRLRPEQEGSVGKGEINVGIHSLAGLQGRYQFTDALSITGQGLVRYRDQGAWDGSLEWAYLTYETPWDLSIRAGKFRFPIFRSSELAYVGYSRIYARPALVFFGVGGYEHLLGAEVQKNLSLQALDIRLQATYGRSENESPPRPNGVSNEVESDNVKILSARVETQGFWVHLAYTHLTTDLTTIRPGRPPDHRGSTNLNMWSAEWQFRLAGFNLEGGYGRSLIDRLQPDETVFYSSLSRPFGNLTPYLLYSRKQFSDLPAPRNPREPPPDESEALDEIYSLGVRYDVKPGLALKLQWDHIKAARALSVSNNLTRGTGSHNAVSLVLDWMF